MSLVKPISAPFYTKTAMILISIIAVGFLCILGKSLLSPLLFSFLFAIVLLPVASFFERKCKLPRSAASGLSVVLFLGVITLIVYFVAVQITDLAQDWPLFRNNFSTAIKGIQKWISLHFKMNMSRQMDYVHNTTTNLLAESTSYIGATFLSISSTVLFLIFVMFDTFFLLFYRRLIIKFLVAVFKEENSVTVYDIIANVQYIIRNYILGLILEMAIVAAICCLAFYFIGIKYSLLLGIITGLFNIIPYIGILTALLLSTLLTIGTGAVSAKIFMVIITIVIVHLIDSNVLLPLIVGSKVKINALITLLGVFIGEMIWGIPGMFLSIPVIAIIKVVCDRIESLKPWGLLLGDEKDEEQPPKIIPEEIKPQVSLDPNHLQK